MARPQCDTPLVYNQPLPVKNFRIKKPSAKVNI